MGIITGEQFIDITLSPFARGKGGTGTSSEYFSYSTALNSTQATATAYGESCRIPNASTELVNNEYGNQGAGKLMEFEYYLVSKSHLLTSTDYAGDADTVRIRWQAKHATDTDWGNAINLCATDITRLTSTTGVELAIMGRQSTTEITRAPVDVRLVAMSTCGKLEAWTKSSSWVRLQYCVTKKERT